MADKKVTYSELITSVQADAQGLSRAYIPAEWLQGRTTYGGLSAALCHQVARELSRDMPLRSAQIAFVGPTGGDVTLKAETLRAGKSSTYVGVDLLGDKGLATRAIFVFGAARPESLKTAPRLTAPDVAAPSLDAQFIPPKIGPVFLENFQVEMIAGGVPMSGSSTAENLYWMRHRDPAAPSDASALLALADCPPPAALSLYSAPAMVSSMNWSIDVLSDTFETEDNWWLARAHAETVKDGYSSQSMTLWNRHGKPVMASRQTIALFG